MTLPGITSESVQVELGVGASDAVLLHVLGHDEGGQLGIAGTDGRENSVAQSIICEDMTDFCTLVYKRKSFDIKFHLKLQIHCRKKA